MTVNEVKKSVTESDAAKAEAAKKAEATKAAEEAKAKATADEKAKAEAAAKAKAAADTKAAYDAAKAEAAGQDRKIAILSGITRLQHSEPSDWTETGAPSVARVAELSGVSDVSRADILMLADGVVRQSVEAPASSAASDIANAIASIAGRADDEDDEEEILRNILVRPVGRGVYNGRLIKPGEDDFRYTGAPAKWFEIVKS